tara:strand:- start:721 stop:1017 length:297 start_codon:yes stop_codon:yes gene_type:complete
LSSIVFADCIITVENVDKEPRNPTPTIVTTSLAGFEATKKPIKNDERIFTNTVLTQLSHRYKRCKRHRIDAPEPAKNKKRSTERKKLPSIKAKEFKRA